MPENLLAPFMTELRRGCYASKCTAAERVCRVPRPMMRQVESRASAKPSFQEAMKNNSALCARGLNIFSAGTLLAFACWPTVLAPPQTLLAQGAGSRRSPANVSDNSTAYNHSSCFAITPKPFSINLLQCVPHSLSRTSKSPTKALLLSLQRKMAAQRNTYQHKLVLLGESGVGKSCLALRFVRDTFSDEQEVGQQNVPSAE